MSVISEVLPKPTLVNYGFDERILNAFKQREFVRNGVNQLPAFKQFIKMLSLVATPNFFIHEFLGGVTAKSNGEIRETLDIYSKSIRGELQATNSSPKYKAYSEGFAKALLVAITVHSIAVNKELCFMDSLSLTLKNIFYVASTVGVDVEDLLAIYIDSLDQNGYYDAGMVSVVAEVTASRGSVAFIMDQPFNYTAMVNDINRDTTGRYSVLVPSMAKAPDMDGVDPSDMAQVQTMLGEMLKSTCQPLSILQGVIDDNDIAIIIVNDSDPIQHLMNVQRAMITATGATAYLDFPTYNAQVLPIRTKDIAHAVSR